MEPYPSRRPVASRYVASGVTSPRTVNGGGSSPISSPSATLASRLSGSSSASSGPGTPGGSNGSGKRPYEGQNRGLSLSSMRDLSNSPTMSSNHRCTKIRTNYGVLGNEYRWVKRRRSSESLFEKQVLCEWMRNWLKVNFELFTFDKYLMAIIYLLTYAGFEKPEIVEIPLGT